MLGKKNDKNVSFRNSADFLSPYFSFLVAVVSYIFFGGEWEWDYKY
jgi:hypothetical protein